MKTRQTSSISIEDESPATIDPSVYPARLICTSSLRSKRSASAPQSGVVKVSDSSVAVMTQPYAVCPASRSRAISGSAVETIVLPMLATKLASRRPERATSTSR